MNTAFESTLHESAYEYIPQTKSISKIPVPLWNKECEVAYYKIKIMLLIVCNEPEPYGYNNF